MTKPRDPLRIAALVTSPICTFELSIAAEIFGLERPEFGSDWYKFQVASEASGPLAANGGMEITTRDGLEAVANAGTIIVPGWHTRDERPSKAVRQALLRAHAEGARLVTICSGAFLLAEVGLLDGKRAATHWVYADKLQSRFPGIEVDRDVLFVEDGQLFTSAGSAAGIDLCMHLVRKDWGIAKANMVARRLVMPVHREGDQRQFVAPDLTVTTNERLSGLIDEMRSEPQREWSIDSMAQKVAMSRRTFIRKFRAASDKTPGEFLLDLRLDVARSLLEQSDQSVERVAHGAGFGSLGTMQHHFRRRLGCSPREYRARFS